MQFNRWLVVLLALIGAESTVGVFIHDISVHVIDVHLGKGGADMKVALFKLDDNLHGLYQETLVGSGITNAEGRVKEFTSENVEFTEGIYKVRFNTKEYFTAMSKKTFYPFVEVVFEIDNADVPYHIPLLLSAQSYTTNRGS